MTLLTDWSYWLCLWLSENTAKSLNWRFTSAVTSSRVLGRSAKGEDTKTFKSRDWDLFLSHLRRLIGSIPFNLNRRDAMAVMASPDQQWALFHTALTLTPWDSALFVSWIDDCSSLFNGKPFIDQIWFVKMVITKAFLNCMSCVVTVECTDGKILLPQGVVVFF